MKNPYTEMTTAQLNEHITNNGVETEDHASLALMRLSQIAAAAGCHQCMCLMLHMLADMPGVAAASYEADVQSAGDVEVPGYKQDILWCAANILRAIEGT